MSPGLTTSQKVYFLDRTDLSETKKSSGNWENQNRLKESYRTGMFSCVCLMVITRLDSLNDKNYDDCGTEIHKKLPNKLGSLLTSFLNIYV